MPGVPAQAIHVPSAFASNSAMRGAMLLALILVPLGCAALYPLLGRSTRLRRVSWVPALGLVLLELIGFVTLWTAAMPVDRATFRYPFIPNLGADLAFHLDGLAFLLCVLVTGIGLAVVAFSATYVPHDFEKHRIARTEPAYYGLLLCFMGSMLGLVCADDLFTLYVFWEATSVSSCLLIALDLRRDKPREAALKAFTITASTGVILFAGFVGIRILSGTASISLLAGAPGMTALFSEHPVGPLIAIGISVGAFAKSAQVPFHAWLPDAMVAPTPISAYLHSATMVAAGVFLLARLAPLLSTIMGHSAVLTAVGVVTALFGAVVAVGQTKLKAILAYSTISQYGFITLLLGLGAYGAAVFSMASHAMLKSGLFLAAGVVSRATGKEDLRHLGGLAKSYPLTATGTFVLASGLAGLPATSGFWMKELLYQSVVHERRPWLMAAVVLGGALTFAYMLRFFWQIFLGPEQPLKGVPERRMIGLLVPVLMLAALVLAMGFSPRLGTVFTDLGAAVAAAAPVRTEVTIHFPPDSVMGMTLLSYALGTLLCAWVMARSRAAEDLVQERALATASHTVSVLRRLGASSLYDAALSGLDRLSRLLGRMQSGRLAHYLLVLMAFPVALGMLLVWPQSVGLVGQPALPELSREGSAFVPAAAATVVLALASALVESLLATVLLIGSAGFMLALLFSILRAPDVALVQVAVEMVTTILALLILRRAPTELRDTVVEPFGRRAFRTRTGSIAIAVALGSVIAVAMLGVRRATGDPWLGQTYVELAPQTGADDVVTTILVDFRSLDTLGEIAVFGVSTLGAVLLLTRRRRSRERPRGKDGDVRG